MNVSEPNRPPGLWCAAGSGGQQTLMQGTQIEASVESIAECRQVTRRIPAKVEGMVGARQAGLEIAEDGVDTLELGNLLGFASGHDRRMMTAAGFSDRAKAGQSVREDRTGWGKVVFRPHRNRLEGEAGHGRQFDAQRASILAERDGGDKRYLVLRATADLASATFAAEIGIIDLNSPD